MSAPGKTAPATGKPERQPLLVDLGFQTRALLPLAIVLVLSAVLLFGLLFFPLSGQIAAEPDMSVRLILQGYLEDIHLRLWPLLLVAVLTAGYFNIYRTLRVLRPVYRLHYALGEMAAGQHPTFDIKAREEFRFLAEDVDQLSQKMKLLSTRNRDILLSVDSHIKRMRERVNNGEIIPRADIEEFLDALKIQVDRSLEAAPPGRR